MQRKVILIIISILILTLSIIGLTYAFMRPKLDEKEEKSNITISACAKVQLKDNGSSINLENSYPMDDDMGLKTKAYEFKISSTCEDYVGFNLYITSLSDNEIEDNNIHFAITSKDNTVLVSNILSKANNALSEFNNEELQELDKGIKGNHKNIYKVYSNNIPLKGESNYKLYLWVDKDASNGTMGKSFKVGLSVKSYNREETLAEYIIKNKDETLIYHDGKCDYEGENNCDLEAGDYSYRYSGANNVVNNYICFGGDCSNDPNEENYLNLYRIIGLFDDDYDGNYNLKIIRADYATPKEIGNMGAFNNVGNNYSGNASYSGDKEIFYPQTGSYYWNYDKTMNYEETINDWNVSNLNRENLNGYFLNTYLKNKDSVNWIDMIEDHTWITEGNISNSIEFGNAKQVYENEIINPNVGVLLGSAVKSKKAKVGLMYISDYGYAMKNNNWKTRISSADNWLYMGLTEWVITRQADYSNRIFAIYRNANISTSYSSFHNLGVRQTFYLNSKIKYDTGAGTKESPYNFLKLKEVEN